MGSTRLFALRSRMAHSMQRLTKQSDTGSILSRLL